ncbi:hypothetical protein CFT13S00388_01810 [Campylobacter fetus subsp. testudinum]|uniref:DMT family transporter n=1 Tax=Campylobacter fetus TaxID=196 RepID=UPI000818B1F5|nr:DMT family transporter [Campylobacter fetus]OCR88195.1 hypothetical protein CFT13S00388_01810 [Campylobacter fetus subsp. testudinum]
MTKYKKGLILAIAGVTLMSFESPAIKFVKASGFDYMFFFGLFLSVSSIFISIVFIKPTKIKYAFLADFKGTILAALALGLSNTFFIYAVKFAGIALPVILLSSAPLFCAILDKIIFKKSTPKSIFIATFFVIIGIVIVVYERLDLNSIIGVILSFLCVISFSMLFVLLSAHKNVSRTLAISGGGLVMVIISLPFFKFEASLSDIITIAIVGIFITPASRILIGRSSLYLIPAQLGLIAILEAILAPFWGFVFLGEDISYSLIIGASIIITSIAINTVVIAKKST